MFQLFRAPLLLIDGTGGPAAAADGAAQPFRQLICPGQILPTWANFGQLWSRHLQCSLPRHAQRRDQQLNVIIMLQCNLSERQRTRRTLRQRCESHTCLSTAVELAARLGLQGAPGTLNHDILMHTIDRYRFQLQRRLLQPFGCRKCFDRNTQLQLGRSHRQRLGSSTSESSFHIQSSRFLLRWAAPGAFRQLLHLSAGVRPSCQPACTGVQGLQAACDDSGRNGGMYRPRIWRQQHRRPTHRQTARGQLQTHPCAPVFRNFTVSCSLSLLQSIVASYESFGSGCQPHRLASRKLGGACRAHRRTWVQSPCSYGCGSAPNSV